MTAPQKAPNLDALSFGPMPKERWKQHPPPFTWYEISSNGRVRSYLGPNQNSKPRKTPKMMKTRTPKDGYPRVTLQTDSGKKVVRRVHLLVARAFLGPTKKRIVRHKDGNPGNPKLSNLEYGTLRQNSHDKYRHGTHGIGDQNSRALLSEKEALEIYSLKGIESQASLANRYNLSPQAVSDIHRGITWSEITGA